MAPSTPRLRILSVGGNAVSAFLSWRLQATNACDVTLVWKSGFDAVHQYGISFKSKLFGNERFKPRHVVRTPEDASGQSGAFDYVLLCVKALPDVYDLAAVIETVVTPQHTCILVNTTHTLGVETHLEQRFPTNVVLSLVSGAEISQLGASEFEHRGSTDIWVGPANPNPLIPATIQSDMAEALAMTLNSGQVNCQVSDNIRQQQYQRMIGPIAFHPTSVLFETPVHAELIEKVGVRSMISDVIDELVCIAAAQDCDFPSDFKERTIETMLRPSDHSSIMYQDYASRRPMEVETYLGSPIKIASQTGVRVPRIETLYALMHHLNLSNQSRPTLSSSPHQAVMPQRLSSAPAGGRPAMPMNGYGGPRMSRGPPPPGGGAFPPGMRRGLPPGGPGPMNGAFPPRGPSLLNGRGGYAGLPLSKRSSFDAGDLEEFSHLAHYDEVPESGIADGAYPDMASLALREKELALRERELALRSQEYGMRRGGGRRPPPPPQSHRGGFDDDEDDEYYEASVRGGPASLPIDPDSFDMMSVTSRRTRKAPSASQIRKNPEGAGSAPMRSSGAFGGFRAGMARNRTSSRITQEISGLHDNIMDNPMMQYSSNRYGTVDRMQGDSESRTNSLTAAKLDELQGGHAIGVGGGPYPAAANPRRTSHSPGHVPYSHGAPGPPIRLRRSSPPSNGAPHASNGYGHYNSRPSPPNGMRQPVPKYPPGQGNSVAPQQVEQHAGVSKHHILPASGPMSPPPARPEGGSGHGSLALLPYRPQVRSLTGSASASAGSGENSPGVTDSTETSAHSSQDSLGVGGRLAGRMGGAGPIDVR